jgi:hypothetical protein
MIRKAIGMTSTIPIKFPEMHSQPIASGIQLTIFRWPDRFEVELIDFGRDFVMRDHSTTEGPPSKLAAAVALAVDRVTAIAACTSGKRGAK